MHKFTLSLALLLFFTPIVFAEQTPETKAFGQCLVDKGSVMYSAWWCPYCFRQLKEFDPSLSRNDMKDENKMKTLSFMKDCGGSEPGTLLAGCVPKESRGVPYWSFRGGIPTDENGNSYSGGVLDMEDIAKLSGCTLPRE